MTYGTKEYQVNAIGQLVKSVSELLAKDTNNKVCVFQSPTGSGKTVMVAKFIMSIIRISNKWRWQTSVTALFLNCSISSFSSPSENKPLVQTCIYLFTSLYN